VQSTVNDFRYLLTLMVGWQPASRAVTAASSRRARWALCQAYPEDSVNDPFFQGKVIQGNAAT